MKTWWLETGWPWLKENWWVLLILPLLGLVAVGRILMPQPRTAIVDPLREADERARVEAETRAKQLEVEKKRLEAELDVIRGRYDELERSFEARLQARVSELRADPDKLRAAMLAAGKGK